MHHQEDDSLDEFHIVAFHGRWVGRVFQYLNHVIGRTHLGVHRFHELFQIRHHLASKGGAYGINVYMELYWVYIGILRTLGH